MRGTRPGLLFTVLTAQTLASMDGSIVTVAAPSIMVDLGASASDIQLVLAGYLLSFGVLTITGARLGDVLGHRRAFLLGVACFTVASLGCGFAASPPALIVARVVQAVGAALMVPQIFTLIQLGLDGAARRRAIGLWSMTAALGVAIGQVAGGLVVSADLYGLSWRPVFLLNVPIGVALMVAGRLIQVHDLQRRVHLDPVGVVVLTLAMAALVVPLVFGPEAGWPAWASVSLCAGIIGLLVFLRSQRALARAGRDPLFEPDALRPSGVRPGILACCAVMGCYTVFVFTVTLYLQDGCGFSAQAAGLAFVPYALGFAALSLSWARLAEPVQRALPVVGPLAFAAGAVGVAVLTRGGGWPSVPAGGLLFLAGAGHAAGYSPLISIVSVLVGPRYASALSGVASTGALLAAVIGIAGLGSVYVAMAGLGPAGAQPALAIVIGLIATALLGTAGCAYSTLRASRRLVVTPVLPRSDGAVDM